MAYRTVQHALDRPEQIPRREHDARGGGQGRPLRGGIGPATEERGELADEPGQTRETRTEHRGEQEDRREPGHDLGDAAEAVHPAMVRAFVEHPDQKEQQGCRKTVGHALEGRSRKPLGIGGGQPQEAEAHVGDGRVGDQALEIGLSQGRESAPEDR